MGLQPLKDRFSISQDAIQPRGLVPSDGGAPAIVEGPATRIDLCGELSVRIAGHDVTRRLPWAQGRLLFAYLVLHRARPVSRTELITALWPADNAPRSAARSLEVVLARLKKAVGPEVIVGGAELSLRLGPDTEIDVERAEKAADEAERALAGDPRRAAAAAEAGLHIVSRRLLPGLEFDWIDARRTTLEETGARLLEAAGRAALDLGELATAERRARDLIAAHPLRESGHALLIEAQARRGNVAEALMTYDRLVVLLREEVGTPPSPRLAALHQRLVDGDPIEAPARPSAGGDVMIELPERISLGSRRAFVGRQRELEHLRSVWSASGAGRRRFACVVGDPGIGKTRLAARFAEAVHADGATVLYGRCDEETVVPYQPFVEALRYYLQHSQWTADEDLRPELQALGQLVPEVRRFAARAGDGPSSDPETQRYWLFEAVSGLLSRWANARPLLLVLDDLQWAEKPTLLLLRHILRRPGETVLMVLATLRRETDHPDGIVAGLIADGNGSARELVLDGLDEAATDAIVASRLEAPATDAFVRALRAKTAGNPLFIEEALRTLAESGALEDAAAASEQLLERMDVPDRVQELTIRRLDRSSPETVETLTVAAVIAHGGGEFGLDTLSTVLATPPDSVLRSIEEAIHAGLVVEMERLDAFAFCHALVRDAIYGRLSRSRCVRLHQRVGEALEARPDERRVPPAQIAYHFWTAREVVGPARTIEYAGRAADAAAAALAYEDAIAFYLRALEACVAAGPAAEERRCDLLLRLGRVQWHDGEEAARDTYRAAAVSAQQRHAAEQLARAALGLGDRYWEADAREVRGYLTEALRMLSADDSVLRVRVLARLGEILHFTADYAEGLETSLEAVEMARRLEERPPGDAKERAATRTARLIALKARHVTLSHIAHLEERLRLISEARSVTGAHRELSGEVLLWSLFDLVELGEIDEARGVHAELVQLAEELNQPLFNHVASAWRGVFAYLVGDVQGAERIMRETEDLGARAHNRDASSTVTALRFSLCRLRGGLRDLLPALEKLGDGIIAPGPWRVGLVFALLDDSQTAEARERYERFAGRSFRVSHDYLWLTTTALLAEACVAFDDRSGAAILYKKLAPYEHLYVQAGQAAWWGSVARYLGMLARTLGDTDAAQRHLSDALERHRARDAALLTALTQYEYALLLRDRDEHARAAEIAAEVEEFATARGLEALAERARGAARD